MIISSAAITILKIFLISVKIRNNLKANNIQSSSRDGHLDVPTILVELLDYQNKTRKEKQGERKKRKKDRIKKKGEE